MMITYNNQQKARERKRSYRPMRYNNNNNNNNKVYLYRT